MLKSIVPAENSDNRNLNRITDCVPDELISIKHLTNNQEKNEKKISESDSSNYEDKVVNTLSSHSMKSRKDYYYENKDKIERNIIKDNRVYTNNLFNDKTNSKILNDDNERILMKVSKGRDTIQPNRNSKSNVLGINSLRNQ